MGGKHSTHVANAYTSDLWVKCDAEKSYVTAASYALNSKSSMNAGVKGLEVGSSGEHGCSGSVELDWHKVQTDFSRISPNNHLRFDVDVSSGKNVVYISVFAADGRVIANGLQRYSDMSIIITRGGDIREAEHGGAWIDTAVVSK